MESRGEHSVALDTRLRGYDGKEGSSTTGFQPMQGCTVYGPKDGIQG
ncbi:MAG: hypothetical protein ABW168_21335 [Sedimenticola sp.]